MKQMICYASLFIACSMSAQNPFIEGIHASDKVEYRDGNTRFSGSGFKVFVTGDCNLKYQVNELWTEHQILTNYVVETSWNWKDVSSIEVDTIKNILRLNGHNPMPRTQKNMDTGEMVDDPSNNTVNVYFKNKGLTQSAANWVIIKVRDCGGTAIKLN